MGVFADQMDALRQRVTSPNGTVAALLEGPNRLSFAFAPGSYPRYTESALAEQLTALLTEVFAVKRQARLDALSRAVGYTVTSEDGAGPWDRRHRELMEARSTTRGRGRSPRDLVRVTNTGLRDWQVRVKPATLNTLDERDFVAEFNRATFHSISDYHRRMTDTRLGLYGKGGLT